MTTATEVGEISLTDALQQMREGKVLYQVNFYPDRDRGTTSLSFSFASEIAMGIFDFVVKEPSGKVEDRIELAREIFEKGASSVIAMADFWVALLEDYQNGTITQEELYAKLENANRKKYTREEHL